MLVKAGRILNIGVALLKYYAELNLNQSGQYGQIYAEKFTSVSLICIGEVYSPLESAVRK